MRSDNRNGPRDAQTSEGLDTGGLAPMSRSVSHGPATREPVYSGNRRIPGLYARTRADGSIVYDVASGSAARCAATGSPRPPRRTPSPSSALQTDYDRGEEYRSPAAAVTVAELVADFIRHMRTRVADPDSKRRRASRGIIGTRCAPFTRRATRRSSTATSGQPSGCTTSGIRSSRLRSHRASRCRRRRRSPGTPTRG